VGHAGERYAADIVRYVNALPEQDREAIVEIGCGLGDIIRHLHARERLGLDHDPGVVAAARFLARLQRGRRPRFETFEFPQTTLTGTYNAIIMVNWIHQVDADTLRAAIGAYYAHHLLPGGCIVLDTVGDRAFMYNHDVHTLVPPGAEIDHLGTYPRARHVWAVR
jgi:SAM-dependent methyltransferase